MCVCVCVCVCVYNVCVHGPEHLCVCSTFFVSDCRFYMNHHYYLIPGAFYLLTSANDWSLTDSKFPSVFRTHLSILIDLNNVVVCMVPISRVYHP